MYIIQTYQTPRNNIQITWDLERMGSLTITEDPSSGKLTISWSKKCGNKGENSGRVSIDNGQPRIIDLQGEHHLEIVTLEKVIVKLDRHS